MTPGSTSNSLNDLITGYPERVEVPPGQTQEVSFEVSPYTRNQLKKSKNG
ncbi:hypothetical protein KGY71_06000 [Candidatus Bipolaricaulota bacterium]|nr:hypothetical protein [Candidatus Bipolaricaulota bacterium]